MLQIQNCQSCAIQTSIQCIQRITVFTTILVLSDHVGETQVLKSTSIEILMLCTLFFSSASENSSKFPWLYSGEETGHYQLLSSQTSLIPNLGMVLSVSDTTIKICCKCSFSPRCKNQPHICHNISTR